MKTAIIGSGFVGRAWAISFARAGHDVALWDADPDAPATALAYIEGILPELAAQDLLGGQAVSAVMARLRSVPALSDAVADVGYVQENTPERVEVKRQVFRDLDAMAPADAVLASSTSALLPSRFVEDVPGRSRCLVLRWAFMGPFETIDLNAPGGVRDYAARYQGIYEAIFPSVQRRVDWTGPVMEAVEAERTALLPREALADRQRWRDRRLMALLAHKRRADDTLGQ